MDYKDHPPTINEIKSDRTGNGSDWTPRDELIALLRDIDAGKTVLSAIFIAGVSPGYEANRVRPFFSVAAASPVDALGTLELARAAYVRSSYGD